MMIASLYRGNRETLELLLNAGASPEPRAHALVCPSGVNPYLSVVRGLAPRSNSAPLFFAVNGGDAFEAVN